MYIVLTSLIKILFVDLCLTNQEIFRINFNLTPSNNFNLYYLHQKDFLLTI